MTRGQKKNLALMVRGTLESHLNEEMKTYEALRRAYHTAQFRNDQYGIRVFRILLKQNITRIRLAKYTLEAAAPDRLNARTRPGVTEEHYQTPGGILTIRSHHRSVESLRDPRD